MNQILVSQKLYVTPELKRKSKRYKYYFAVSIFCICMLSSYYIYAEWDRSKSEQISKQILETVELKTQETEGDEDSVIVVDLHGDDNSQAISVDDLKKQQNENNKNGALVYQTKQGLTYVTEAILKIPKIDLSYPILSETSDELLKISLNKLAGPEPNKNGNYCIVGHNYRNGKMFGSLNKLELGDIVSLVDLYDNALDYKIYNIYVVEPHDVSCINQDINRTKELTLITCTNYGTQRLIIKAREIK